VPPRKTDCPECGGMKPHSRRPRPEWCPLALERERKAGRERMRTKRSTDPAYVEREREYLRGWRERNPEYLREWKGRNPEYMRDWGERRREEARGVGLCTKCYTREPEPLMAKCVRCHRYDAEYSFLGYSTIPLAKGSEG
jgi:hypothetical protein